MLKARPEDRRAALKLKTRSCTKLGLSASSFILIIEDGCVLVMSSF